MQQSQIDILDPARANALFVTLGMTNKVDVGDELPPFFHQINFWDPTQADDLGRDGHPKTGKGLIPDLGLPRRMWAGGQLEFLAPLRVGQEATKTSTVHKTAKKTGRTGPLAFVTLLHEISQNGQICVREFQDLVYREDPDPSAPSPTPRMAETDETGLQSKSFSTTQLFRYSALTFNGHRIHYDLDYARDVEGYGGLVTHGPLLAQLLMLQAKDQLGSLSKFSFRGTAPLMHFETAELCWKDGQSWVRAADGRLCMTAQSYA